MLKHLCYTVRAPKYILQFTNVFGCYHFTIVNIKVNLALKMDPWKLLELKDRHTTFWPGKMKWY